MVISGVVGAAEDNKGDPTNRKKEKLSKKEAAISDAGSRSNASTTGAAAAAAGALAAAPSDIAATNGKGLFFSSSSSSHEAQPKMAVTTNGNAAAGGAAAASTGESAVPPPAAAASSQSAELVPPNRRVRESAEADECIKHQLPNGFTVIYSPQYSDDTHIYRHITVPRRMWRDIARLLSTRSDRRLSYSDVVEKLGISMSADWYHYLSNRRDSTLFFKRPRRGP